MIIVRGNVWSELEGAPAWFLKNLERHLSVAVDAGQKVSTRFGSIYTYQGEPWGSLLHKTRVPAGLTSHVIRIAQHYDVSGSVRDIRVVPEDQVPWWSVKMRWRPYQDRVHKAAMENPAGVIDASPRSGKTSMAARLIDQLALPALYIAPSVQITRQTHEVFVSHFGADNVGRFDGNADPSDRDISRAVVVATTASALKLPKEFYDTRKVLVIDEVHHGASESIHQISVLAEQAYYRYGLTGTFFRTGEDGLAMEAACGETIAKIQIDELIPDFLAPPRVFYLRVPGKIAALDWVEAYDEGIVNYAPRNALVVKAVAALRAKDIPTIVLTRRRAHADLLGSAISDSVVVKGGENALTSRGVRDFLAGRHGVLIGTTVIGEGLDLPRAAALVYASGGNDGVSMMQSYYRPLTAHPDKDAGRIYDFWDLQHATLRQHSSNRHDMARKQFGAERVFRIE